MAKRMALSLGVALLVIQGFPLTTASAIHETPNHPCFSSTDGYWLVARNGQGYPFGSAGGASDVGSSNVVGTAFSTNVFFGEGGLIIARSDGSLSIHSSSVVEFLGPFTKQVVAVATALGLSKAVWLAGADGAVYALRTAPFYGSMGGRPLSAPIVGMAVKDDASGYWLVASDGGVFSFGGATFHGSMAGRRLNAPIVGMAAHPSGHGYWLVAADGGVFAFGDASYYGSTGSIRLRQPIVGIGSRSSSGYYLVAADGGVFAFGLPFFGSAGGKQLSSPIVGVALAAGREFACE